jgi:hypothetical protein
MKAGVFKLNMHPKEFFDGNPYHEGGKVGKNRGDAKERSKSAPADKKPFKYSSPGKSVCFDFSKKQKKFDLIFSSAEIKMVVLINFPNVVKKILTLSARFILKLKMKLINKEKRIIRINILNHVQRNL